LLPNTEGRAFKFVRACILFILYLEDIDGKGRCLAVGINPFNALEWTVNFGTEAAPEWLNATAPVELFLPHTPPSTALDDAWVDVGADAETVSGSAPSSRSWVVKATVSRNHKRAPGDGGDGECWNKIDESCVPTITLYTCELLTVNGLQNRCNMSQQAIANISQTPPQKIMPPIHSANITIGAEYDAAGAVINGFSGALEEISWNKIDTGKWDTFVWNCPGTVLALCTLPSLAATRPYQPTAKVQGQVGTVLFPL